MSFLIFDADDTLWENNIYFERAFDDFVAFSRSFFAATAQIRDILNEIELVNAKLHGYGAVNFGRNLQQAYRHLAEREIRDPDLAHVMSLAERILEQPIELIEGVEDTLDDLGARHELTLFTKGHPEEQRLKVDRSGLGRYFAHTAIVKEKDAEAYRRLVSERGFDPNADLDDRQFAQIRHQSGNRGRVERGVGPACAHLGAGASGSARWRDAVADR